MNRHERRRNGYRRPMPTLDGSPLCVHDGHPCIVMTLGTMIEFQEADPLPGLDSVLFAARAVLPLGSVMQLCSFCGCLVPLGLAHLVDVA
jgi:hypothetical protein